MKAFLAAIPPCLALVLLPRVRPAWAALAALSSGVLLAVTAFGASASSVWAAASGIAAAAVEIALIILGGILLNRLLRELGAHAQLGEWLTSLRLAPSLAVLLIVLGVTPFAESVTGFGVGVVVAVPLLLNLGIPPLRAGAVALLGLVVVPWGALAPGTLVAAELAGLDFHELGVRSAALSLPVYLACGAAALGVARTGGRAARAAGELALAAAVLWVGVWAANALLGTPVAGLCGGLLATTALLALARLRDGVRLTLPAPVRRALLPYLTLGAGLILARLAVMPPPVQEALGGWQEVLTSPALWLLLACALAPALLGGSWRQQRACLPEVLRSWSGVGLTTTLFLLLGAEMTRAGMSEALAGAAAGLGRGYLALAPWMGALGGFLTGSNSGANAMFAASQAQAARSLGVAPLLLVALQNVSASLATMASGPRVALAVSLLPAATRQGAAPGSRSEPHGRGGAGEDPARYAFRTTLTVDVIVLATLSALAVVLGYREGAAGAR